MRGEPSSVGGGVDGGVEVGGELVLGCGEKMVEVKSAKKRWKIVNLLSIAGPEISTQ